MTPQRITWLDLVRGACVLGMIETHVLNTFLATATRAETWFVWLNYLNGLIAPAFLFVAGYTQGLGMRQSGTRPRVWGRRVRRLVSVWLLGYALHFPLPQMLAGQWTEAHRIGTQVDVLQCLTTGLLLLLAAERYARRWADAITALGLVVFVLIVRPEMAAGWQFSPTWLLAYCNGSTGSLFPLFPWLGFVFAGFLASAPLASAPLASAVRIAIWGGTVAVAYFTQGSIGFFFERLASLLALIPVVQWIASRWELRWLQWTGRESLVLYAVHLVLIEIAASAALSRKAQSVGVCALAFVVILALTLGLTMAWARRVRTTGRRAVAAQIGAT